MFNIGFAELLLVLLVAFLVVGPKDLPKVARWLGRMVRKLRQLIREVKKETGWDEFEKEFKDTKSDMNDTFKEVKQDLD
ncbi:MAG: twin-arginine translocase subunit TatB, partial [Clostridia bacterium]|nr:twin-arginine translocase subunit TatB [Clostridia bacterium]